HKFSSLNSFLSENQHVYSSIIILTDSNVHKHCLPVIVEAVQDFSGVEVLEIEPGEQQKNLAIAEQLWIALMELGADKNLLLVNVGGGVVTDLGGFIAATYKRGVDYINIPTSLLGAVDAAVGGKTGLDLNEVKNQIGCFWPSKGVFIYPEFFNSLPDEEFYSGFAECIKHILIGRPKLWEELKAFTGSYRDFVSTHIQDLVEVKNEVVALDPFEKNQRQYLNYGHTIGHALEAWCMEQNKAIPHGFAVAWGILAENYLSVNKGLLPEALAQEIASFIKKTYAFPSFNESMAVALVEYCRHDKKNEQGEIRFAFLENAGKMISKQSASPLEIKEAIQSAVQFLN
ncbi:MAG: 3-dehydroquinate synthase, partial [Luteibaculum sp.]